ncbi:MAG TPA: TetR/AcrR family transcriptional regulator [Rummeliibacillus sp.]|nr:TetR/AcrR family transcriptional regulator [Rummeliibacillus sp.]
MKIDGRINRSLKTKAKILMAAQNIFKDLGYKNTTVNKIAMAAGAAHGTVYIHFPEGKDEILAHFMTDLMDEFYSVADIEFEPKTTEEAYKIIRSQIFLFLSLAKKYKTELLLFYEGIQVSQLLKEKWGYINENFIKRICSDITYSQSLSLAKAETDPEVAARILFYNLEHFLWDIIHNRISFTEESIAKNLTNIYMYGLYNQ